MCIDLCKLFRKKNTITESIACTFKKLTDQECHAELCLAEALLMNALLTFIKDDNLGGLIRGSLKVRKFYGSFRACEQIMKSRVWILDADKDSATSKTHFDSVYVYMGIGTFNLMISILPGRILKILQIIGFSGSKSTGLEYLKKGNREKGLRQVLCGLSLLGFHLMVTAMICDRDSDSDIQMCDEILTAQLAKYPKANSLIAERILQTINKELSLLKDSNKSSKLYYADNRALCLLLRGAYYRQMGPTNLALQDLQDCLAQSGIKEDFFLMPYAYVEFALCNIPINKNQAIYMLQNTKKKFSHYSLESRLHLRIHMALMNLNDSTEGEF
ncbi:tetratricopeptide repeat protein 39B-like isoform X2 [Drosophila subobscura]|uniref:tetratricopeptide repeat protein 39B-like isoform X2 n=1 Tax=Drosophila subobscura TaxID=7241 RepID=UPI00155A0675|nr:tetratricopeptide repeat protein 39B-like isoform X2 [Drosophila subobscura]